MFTAIIPKAPTYLKPTYGVIQQYSPNPLDECAVHLKFNKLPFESDHYGGYPVVSGTPSSGASGTIQNMVYGWIPWEGPIPSLLVNLDYKAHLLEIKPEFKIL